MNLSVNQAFAIVRNAYNQITGITGIEVLDTSNFMSVANTVARIGYNAIIPGLLEQFGKIAFKERPYENHFPNLFESMEQYGVNRGKGQFVTPVNSDGEAYGAGIAETDTSYSAVGEGKTFGTYTMSFEKPVQFFFTGKNVFMCKITFTRGQLKQAFASPEAMANYLSAKLTKVQNDINQQIEGIQRTALVDYICAKYYLDTNTSTTHAIHLVTEFNQKYVSGTAKTYAQICQDSELYAKFCRFVAVAVDELVADLGERDTEYHVNPTSHAKNPGYILQHSSADNLRMYRLRQYEKEFNAQGLVDTRNLDLVPKTAMTTVNYWQSNEHGQKGNVKGKPEYMKTDGTTSVSTNLINVNNVYAVIMDKDALRVGLVDSWTQETPLDAEKGVANRYWHYEFECRRDDTEKGVILVLD